MGRLSLNRKGVTLIELIITVAITAIVIQISYSVFFVGNKSFVLGKNKGFAQQEVRVASDFITGELRSVKGISDTKYNEGSYFSLELIETEDNKDYLYLLSYDGDIEKKRQKIFGPIHSLQFEYKDSQEQVLNIKIEGKENKNSGGKVDYSTNFSIRLENWDNDGFKKPETNFISSKIYYIKYE